MSGITEQLTELQRVQTRWSLRSTTERTEAWLELQKALYLEPTFAAIWPELQTTLPALRQQASALLSQVATLPGVTGEANALYLSAKGICLLVIDEGAPLSAVVMTLAAALLTGNGVVCSFHHNRYDEQEILLWAVRKAGFERLVLFPQHIHANSLILESAISQVVCLQGIEVNEPDDSASFMHSLLQELGERAGSILVPTMLADLPPDRPMSDFLLRFVTERTRSINLTAIGGNIALLRQVSRTIKS